MQSHNYIKHYLPSIVAISVMHECQTLDFKSGRGRESYFIKYLSHL